MIEFIYDDLDMMLYILNLYKLYIMYNTDNQ